MRANTLFTFSFVESDKSDAVHVGGVADRLHVSSAAPPAALEVDRQLVDHPARGQRVGHPGHHHRPGLHRVTQQWSRADVR